MIARTAALPARYFSFVLSYTDELGLPRRALMRAAGLSRLRLAVPHTLLPLAQFDALVQAVNAVTGRTDLGFELGTRATYTLHDKLGEALEHCRDVDQAVRLCARYFPIITPSYLMEYRRGPRLARISFRPTVAMPPATLMLFSESHAMSFHCLGLRGATRRVPPYTLHMPLPRPAHASRYGQLAPARVFFEPGALPEVRIEVPSDFMDSPFRSHDPMIVTERQVQLEQALRAAVDSGRYGDWLRMLLERSEGRQLALADVAAALHLPAYTLVRRLAAEGIEFRTLATEVRLKRAVEMLTSSDASIATIATRLGYAHTSNFISAFRTRTGTSPRKYRQAQKSR